MAEAAAVCWECSVLDLEDRRSDGHKSQHGARTGLVPEGDLPPTTTEKQTAQVQVLAVGDMSGGSGDLGNGEGVREGVRTGIRKMPGMA